MDETLNNVGKAAAAGTTAATAAGGAATGTAPTTPSVSGYGDYTADTINKIYDAQKTSQLNQLASAYQTNLAEAERSRDKISGNYQETMNQLSNEYERTKKNTNEQLAANGMNTGAGSQAALAQRSEYQRDYGKLGKSEDEALATAQQGIQNLTEKYNADQTAALADNDYKRATALLSQYKENYNQQIQAAEKLAAMGDFSGYEPIYGKEKADQLQQRWFVQNPDLAYMTGNITTDQRDNIKNGRPINYGLDESGNKIAPIPGSGGDAGANEWFWFNTVNPQPATPPDPAHISPTFQVGGLAGAQSVYLGK